LTISGAFVIEHAVMIMAVKIIAKVLLRVKIFI